MSKVILRSRLAAILLSMVMAVVAFSSSASAQQTWTTNYTATFGISCVKFLDAQGYGSHGFIGGDMSTLGTPTPAIYYTFNGGTTWTNTNTLFNGYVTDFTFANAAVGFASVRGGGSSQVGILGTTDSGLTWKALANGPHEVNGIYFNSATGLLIAATASEGVQVSNDLGNNWTCVSSTGLRVPPYTNPPDSNTAWTGIAFIDNKYGIISNDGGGCPTPMNPEHWLRTTDGGLTWHNQEYPSFGTTMYLPSWQPVGINGTSTFYATSDCDGQMYSSNDYGFSWQTVVGFNNPLDQDSVTGSMAGDGCTIFASSQSATSVMQSTNDGVNWISAIQGPMSPIRTRFYVSPSRIWAFRDKTLSYAPRLSTSQTHILPSTTITFGKAGCGVNDTVLHLVGCQQCSAGTVFTSASVQYNTGALQQNFSVVGFNSHHFCGIDSVRVRYSPSSANADTGYVHLVFTTGANVVDTVITVYGPGVRPRPEFPRTVVARRAGCDCLDTTFDMWNHSCTAMSFTWDTSGSAGVIQIDDQQPVSILPNSNYTFHVHMCSIEKGTYNLGVKFHVSAAGGINYDTLQYMTFLVSSTPSPLFRGLSWQLPDRCGLHDTTIAVVNTICDTLYLIPPDTGTGTDFTYSFPKTAKWPVKLAPGAIFFITVHPINTNVGTHTRHFIWTDTVHSLPGEVFTYPMDVSYTIKAKITTQADATPHGADFGAVPNCDNGKQMTIQLTNNKCVGMRISTLTATLPPGFTIDPGGAQVGDSLKPGQTESLVIHFNASIADGTSGSLKITYRNGTDSATDVLPLRGFPVSSVVTSIKDTALDFGTLQVGCDGSKLLIDSILNGPCSKASISAITQSGNTDFTLISPKLHDKIPAGQAVPIEIQLTPNSTGTVTGTITIETRDTTENIPGSTNIITFTANVKPAIHAPALASIPNTPMRNCDIRDTCITLTNNGQCDTLRITAASTDVAEVTVASANPAYGTPIAPGQSQTFCLHFAPNSTAAASLTGTLTLATNPPLTAPFNIPLSSCQGPAVIVTTSVPDSNLTATVCTPSKVVVTVAVSDSSRTVGFAINNASGSGFSHTASGSTATKGNPVFDTILFAPNKNGIVTATLAITINGVTRNIPLQGTASAPLTARLGVRIKGGAMTQTMNVNTAGTDQQILEVYFKDGIANAPMNTVTFLLGFYGDLLSAINYSPAPSNTTADLTGITMTIPITPGKTYAAGDVIETVTLVPRINKMTSTNVIITNQRFNDSLYNLCTYAALSAGDVIIDNLNLSCTDTFLVANFNDQLTAMSKSFSIAPNPVTRNGATVKFTTDLTGDILVDLIDAKGQTVTTLVNGPIVKGDYSLPLPVERLAEGTYFARVQAGGFSLVRKFIVQKN